MNIKIIINTRGRRNTEKNKEYMEQIENKEEDCRFKLTSILHLISLILTPQLEDRLQEGIKK